MLNVQTVHADGETPTEPPVPTQVETEPPTTEPTEAPTEVATEAPTEIPTDVPVESTPTAPESTPEPEGTPTPVAEILTQVPEETQVVIIDETGASVPLASEEAAEIAEMFDPMWCPAGVLPGGPGCTTNFSSIALLINNMISNTGSYAQNGVIYFVETTGVQTTGASFSLTDSSLGGGDFNTLNDFNITLQGGWNGQNLANAAFTGTTNFGNNSISVGSSGNVWAGSVTLSNFSFSAGNQSQVNVYTSSGNISLSNVDVLNHQGGTNTAILSSTSGNITVQSGSTFDGNGSDSNGFSATTGSGSITISDTSFTDIVRNGGNTYDGASLSASTVTLTDVTATGNDGNGIAISNASLVTLNNVTASTNGTESGPGGINGNTGSGVFVNGTASSRVIINGGTFQNNQEYGVEVGNTSNTTTYIQATPTCSGNDSNTAGLGCYNDTTIFDNTAPSITPTVTGTSGANGWHTSNVNVTWAVSDPESGIRTQSGCTSSSLTTETTGVTLTCSATNNANLSHSVSVTIKIDKTAPSAALSASGTAGANGWYTSNVTVQTTGADAISGVTCTADQLFSTDTTGTQVNGSCTNGAGLVTNAAPITIKIDKTAPVVSLTVTGGTLGANNWFTSNVTIQTSGSESTSGPITCTGDQFQTAETTGTAFNGSCTNQAGLIGSASPLNIKLDKTNPTITFNGRTTPNANGWNNTNVTASWTCSDSVSGPVNDTVSQTVSTEGAGQSASGTCTDLAGNTASDTQGGINIDETAPSLSLPSGITAEATSSAGALVTYSATVTDNLDNSVSVSCTPASGSTFPIGSTQVNCSSTDQADNTATGSFAVNVGDTTGPIIAAHADVTAEATSASGANVAYTSPSATDAVDGPVAVTCAPDSGGSFPLGDTTVTCNAADSRGNDATPETFVVHVVDTIAPVIASHADITVEATSSAGAVVSYTSPATSDIVDGAGTASCAPASGETFPLGDTIVTCDATDSSGNAATSTSFVVHVIDSTAPVIAFHGDLTVEATSSAGAVVSYTSPATSDAVDGAGTASCSPASGTTFPLGDTTITCTAADSNGNEADPTTFVVHVVDTTGPVIAFHGDVTVQATSAAGAVVSYTSPATSDAVDGAGTATCAPASGIAYPMGDTTVTCNASDSHGNVATSTSFVIHVIDSASPLIAAHDDVIAEATSASGAVVTYTAPTANDIVDGPVPVTCAPASGGTFPPGDTTITCNASDSQGNDATPTTFLVRVVDSTAPAVAFHADITVEATSASGAAVTYTAPTATDIVDGPLAVSCLPAPGATFPLGNTTITCSATDAHQNTGTGTFVVHVVDTTAPQIAAAGDITVEAGSSSGAVATYTTPSATDSVDGTVAVTCSPASGTTFPLGNTTVTCNAMDTHNNIATPETFVVHVVDTTAPTLNLPANITTNATGPSGAVVSYSATGTDAVDQSVSVTCSLASGSTFPLGANLVTCTGSDNFQNTSEGSFFVNVLDPGGPMLTLPNNMTVEATGPGGAVVSFSASATDIVDGNVPVTCTPASGTTFDFGTTTVTCEASDSSEHTNTGAFLVTVQDTTAPAIAPHADVNIDTDSATGVSVTYTSPSTTDAVDGAGVASCTPASGMLFPVADTTVTCTATDAHGNTSTSTFVVQVNLTKPGTTETPGTTITAPPGFIIPLTGGELISLDCNSVLWAFGIKVSFFNLCDYQTTLHSVAASDLPAALPEGFEFVMGLNVDILSEGQFIEELPAATGIEMDFPIYEQSPDQFAVLFWSEADGKWIEVSGQINADQISQTLNATAENELYQVLTGNLSDLFFQALTTHHTGVFILVKK